MLNIEHKRRSIDIKKVNGSKPKMPQYLSDPSHYSFVISGNCNSSKENDFKKDLRSYFIEANLHWKD